MHNSASLAPYILVMTASLVYLACSLGENVDPFPINHFNFSKYFRKRSKIEFNEKQILWPNSLLKTCIQLQQVVLWLFNNFGLKMRINMTIDKARKKMLCELFHSF